MDTECGGEVRSLAYFTSRRKTEEMYGGSKYNSPNDITPVPFSLSSPFLYPRTRSARDDSPTYPEGSDFTTNTD